MSIGVQPSQTSVVLKTGDGMNGTIEAATEKAAGCMTAEHVRLLYEINRWRVGIETGQPLEGENLVTKNELVQALQAVRGALPAPGGFDARRITARLDALEDAQVKALTLPPPTPLQSTGAGLSADATIILQQMQADIAAINHSQVQITQRIDALERFAEEIITNLPAHLQSTADAMGQDSIKSRLTRVEETLRVIVEESIATVAGEQAHAN